MEVSQTASLVSLRGNDGKKKGCHVQWIHSTHNPAHEWAASFRENGGIQPCLGNLVLFQDSLSSLGDICGHWPGKWCEINTKQSLWLDMRLSQVASHKWHFSQLTPQLDALLVTFVWLDDVLEQEGAETPWREILLAWRPGPEKLLAVGMGFKVHRNKKRTSSLLPTQIIPGSPLPRNLWPPQPPLICPSLEFLMELSSQHVRISELRGCYLDVTYPMHWGVGWEHLTDEEMDA